MSRLEAVVTAAILAGLAGCAGTPPAASPAVRAELAPAGALRVAVFTGNPVIGTRDKATGQVTGTTAVLGRELAARSGVPADIREYTAIAKLMEDAKTGAWDVAVVAIDPARRNVIDYAPPHIVVDLTYLVAPGAPIRSVADADRAGVRIAAARGAATTLFLERTLKNATVVTAENEPAAFALVREGKAQAYAQNRYMLLGLAQGLPGAHVVGDRFSAAELALALPKGRPAALRYVSDFVESAKRSGSVARAIEGAGLQGVAVAPAAR
jgi:polar amino acid transport system substrate-binding protein